MEDTRDRVICNLKAARTRKKMSQSELAERVGIKRQAIYDMESGRYMPNTLIALRLAKELDCRVEDLFILDAPSSGHPVTLAENTGEAGCRVSVVRIRDRLVAYPMDDKWLHGDGFQAADGTVGKDGGKVHLLQAEDALKKNILLMGCDPAFALLSSHVSRRAGDTRVYCRFASSHAAVKALAAGRTHIAGTHLHNTDAAESNISLAEKMLTGAKVMVFGFSTFEEGLMVAPGNPHGIRTPSDLAKGGIRLVNREEGAALRVLLDDCLARAGVPTDAVTGYGHLVASHNQGARMVTFGLADAALGLRAVAVANGLDFVPIQAVRCDLVIPYDFLDLPPIKILLDVLQTHAMRKELASLPGYDSSCTGKLIGEVNSRF
ncbi:MAG: substrate-binding domain-containing protein [Desulfosalsimonadaceae bacterium]